MRKSQNRTTNFCLNITNVSKLEKYYYETQQVGSDCSEMNQKILQKMGLLKTNDNVSFNQFKEFVIVHGWLIR